jgi:hypothetical protein
MVFQLSAFAPDEALARAGVGESGGRPATAAELIRISAAQDIIWVDGLEAIQQQAGTDAGNVTDCRFRQFLTVACAAGLPGVGLVVVSRLAPPGHLPESAITVLTANGAGDPNHLSLPRVESPCRRILEMVALTNRATKFQVIRSMSGLEEELIRKALREATRDGLLLEEDTDSYRMPNRIRDTVMADESQTSEERNAAIERLRHAASEPELLLELLVDADRTQEAVMTYWDTLGNFGRLAAGGRMHLGAALCQRLNGGLGPDVISEQLSRADGAWAVVNDWSQYAISFGDAPFSAAAAESAYRLAPQEPQWYPAQLAGHVGKALLLAGDLRGAIKWCDLSWEHARNAMRQTGGFAVREIMDAYDWAAVTMAKVYLRLEVPAEIRRLLDDLMAIHVHARESVVEFNQSSIIPLEP